MLTRILAPSISLLALSLPIMASAQFDPDGGPLGSTLANLISFSHDYIIPFILGLGFLFFVWGMFLYFIKGGADDDAKTKGKSLIIYALSGFIIIFIFWGVVEMLAESTGLQQSNLELEIPVLPGANQ
ncbi:hypothetical protein K2Q16_04540 [Patescibacteria group bacterium]|nr:hypothetical protein [Patescibacteria group bacterium]